MILQGQERLEEKIVVALSKHANLSVEELQKRVAQQSKQYSLPAIYKELGKLEFQGVVVKEKKRYSLRLSWVLELLSLADSANRAYLENPSVASIVPALGKKNIWHFTDLLRLNNFWAQVLLILLNGSRSKTLFTWMPHSWFHLAYTESEAQYVKSLELSKTHLYLICGGRDPLDRWSEQFWKGSHVKYSFAKSPFERDRDVYWNIIDNYVSTVTLDAAVTAAIDRLYTTTHSVDQTSLERILPLLQQRVKATMWLELNPAKAQKLKKRFIKFFGIRKG